MSARPSGPRPRRTGLVAAVLIIALLGCGRENVQRAHTLTILYPGGDRVLGLPEDDSPKQLVFLPLVTRDTTGAVVGQLLDRAEREPGTSGWIYHLRNDVRWHDGVAVTAHDIAFTIDMMSDSLVNWLTPGRLTLTVFDDSTLRVAYRAISTGGLLHVDDWQVYFPKHLLEHLDRRQFGDWEFWKRPVGNGPYRFVRSQPGETIELKANPDYYAGKPPIERLILRLAEPSLAPLLSGEVNLMPLRPLEVLKLRADPRFELSYAVGDMRLGVVWNHSHPLFADAVTRRALTMAINRVALNDVLNLPPELPISDGVYTEGQYVRRELTPPLPYDVDESRRLFHSLGWGDRDGDGILERGGRPFRFTAIVSPEAERAAVYVQEQLRRAGVAMVVQPVDGQAAVQRVLNGEIEAAVHRVRNTIRGRLGLIATYGPRSFIGYHRPHVADLLRRLERAFEPPEIDALYRELNEVLADEVPVTFLSPIASVWVSDRRVRGLDAFPYPEPFSQIEHLWLGDRRQP